MLYKKKGKELTKEMFKNPPKEYRGAPFWAWNTTVTEEIIERTLKDLMNMGMGGAHLHSRTGMNIPYLSDEFFRLVQKSLDIIKKEDMLLWLYDEDRWPSGYGGGMVTKNHSYRSRFLVFSPVDITGKNFDSVFRSSARPYRSLERTLLRCFEIKISADGWLCDYAVTSKEKEVREGYHKWYAYMEVSADNPWFNKQAYVDTLNMEAVNEFIKVSYQKYYDNVGDEFGKTIPAIFTDEPQFCHKQRMGNANGMETSIIPYTEGLEEFFISNYSTSLLDYLPELFWEKGEGEVSLIRYQYHDAVCELFTQSYSVNIGKWCKEHGIMLTGHMMEEPTLMTQTAALGEAMRSYQAFDIPGIDMLCDRRELTTAKQAQSAAHQFGKEGVLSEIYGVTNWDFDFRGHKLQGDWQAALGVTVRVHHLNWCSMKGEAKRDYPAAIGCQSPWYMEYPFVEEHFARVNTALTRGCANVRIGVIHPIESYWLYWGTEEKTAKIREELENGFLNITNWLLFGLMDFDYICESLLPDQQTDITDYSNGFKVGAMKYDVVIVPNCITLRESTADRLEAFAKSGGTVIITGEKPQFFGAQKSERVDAFVNICKYIPFTKNQILNALSKYRSVDVVSDQGIRTNNIIYQHREEEKNEWLFFAHVYPMDNPDIPVLEKNTICIKGIYEVIEYNTLTGETANLPATYQNGMTLVNKDLYGHDSLLLKLITIEDAGKTFEGVSQTGILDKRRLAECKTIFEPCKTYEYSLSEPNVLVLDLAKYRLDSEPWSDHYEEILRIDNIMREKLSYPLRMEALAQPWTDTAINSYEHTLSLRFDIRSEIDIRDLLLAMEEPESVELMLNSECISNEAIGYYTDRDIKTVMIPEIKKGINELVIHIPFHRKCNIEACYLLGSFGVYMESGIYVIADKPKRLSFNNLVQQGFPFYGGNVTYQISTEVERGSYIIEISRFRAPVIVISIDGKKCMPVAYAPYRTDLGYLTDGKHSIEITVFGSRINTFGQLHNCNDMEPWYGPNSWRTVGTAWSYEYELRKTGILKTPLIYRQEEIDG
ncbi:MAG TPA: hypothetical protein GXX75_21940 [Clostridiales bacterium]|nr:hypothetical protein [Clostridiales bacterium]